MPVRDLEDIPLRIGTITVDQWRVALKRSHRDTSGNQPLSQGLDILDDKHDLHRDSVARLRRIGDGDVAGNHFGDLMKAELRAARIENDKLLRIVSRRNDSEAENVAIERSHLLEVLGVEHHSAEDRTVHEAVSSFLMPARHSVLFG